jgi:hypothetical protein
LYPSSLGFEKDGEQRMVKTGTRAGLCPLGLPLTWLPEDCQVGPPIGQLRIGEHHDTILGSFVEAKHSLLVIFD